MSKLRQKKGLKTTRVRKENKDFHFPIQFSFPTNLFCISTTTNNIVIRDGCDT